MALSAVLVDKRSPFLGEACALCKQPFAPGDEVAICPEDSTRHHAHCWRAYGNKCTAYGCQGSGELIAAEPQRDTASGGRASRSSAESAKVQTLPARGFHCAQSCLLIAIALAIVLFAIGCFGLWAIADYVVLEIFGWQYRQPLTGALVPGALLAGLSTIAAAFPYIH